MTAPGVCFPSGACLKDGQPTNYASQASYEAHGGLKSVVLGNNLMESWSYIPSRQQPWKIQLGTVAQPSSVEELLNDYCPSTPFLGASCASNNGNVMGQKRGSLGAATTVYTYDYLNRLLSATESGNGPGYSRTYGYDGFGNGWVASNSGVVLSSFTPTSGANFATNNRLLINNAAYDDSGNQTGIGGYAFKWDGDNRMAESVIGGVTTAYVYDGEGRRVKKVKTTTAPATTTETRYVYNASGALAAEYGPAEPESDTEYFMADHLGSTRLVTHANGTPKRALDYLPFGEEIPQGVSGRGALYPADGATPTSGKKFTGHYRDSETGLDYFLARYYSGAQGRFTSPDPIHVNILRTLNPQRWHMYAYAVNNPLAYIDPDGRDAAFVNLTKQVPGAGHAGLMSIHSNGKVTYASFGPESPGTPVDRGLTRVLINLPTIEFNSSGGPTQQSLAAVAAEIAKFEHGQDPSTIKIVYFKTSEAEASALDTWIQEQRRRNFTENAPMYLGLGSNCANFCVTGLGKAGVYPNRNSLMYFMSIPNSLFLGYVGSGGTTYPEKKKKEKVTTKYCTTTIIVDGKETCP